MTIQKVVVLQDIKGYGHETQNVARFGTRFKFPEIWDFHEGSVAKEEAAEVEALQGVEQVQCLDKAAQYDLIVKKATAFTWAELGPAIIQILEHRHDRLTEGRPYVVTGVTSISDDTEVGTAKDDSTATSEEVSTQVPPVPLPLPMPMPMPMPMPTSETEQKEASETEQKEASK